MPRSAPCWVYVITDGHGHTKIGIGQNVSARLATLQVGNPHRLSTYAKWRLWSTEQALYIEKSVLMGAWRHWAVGEWLRADPAVVARLVEKKVVRFGRAPYRRHADSYFWQEPSARAAIEAAGGLRVIEVDRQ
jgi:hypothetical protein